MRARFELQVKHRTETGPDKLGRVDYVWEPSPDPLKVIGVGPDDSTETDGQMVEARGARLMLYMPRGVQVALTDRVVWQGADWEVVKVASYDVGPSGPGGNTAVIEKRGG